jgi:hypothetical protein
MQNSGARTSSSVSGPDGSAANESRKSENSTIAGCPALAATTQAETWRHGDAQLLLAEAFITTAGKPEPLPAGQHAADALAAGLAFAEVQASSAPLVSAVCYSPQDPFNLRTFSWWARRCC